MVRCSKEIRNIRWCNKQTTTICQITNLLDIHQFLKIPLYTAARSKCSRENMTCYWPFNWPFILFIYSSIIVDKQKIKTHTIEIVMLVISMLTDVNSQKISCQTSCQYLVKIKFNNLRKHTRKGVSISNPMVSSAISDTFDEWYR